MDNDELDSIFLNSFLKDFNKKQDENIQFVKEARIIAEEKKTKLIPIMEFLQRFSDIGVKVYHRETFDTGFNSSDYNTVVNFQFYEQTTSKSWAPGISIIIEHPALIEIAVPNDEQEGLFVLNISTHHPDSLVLKQKFTSLGQICQALAVFIQKNTISIDQNPKKIINSLENKKRFDGKTIKEEEEERLEKENNNKYQNDKENSVNPNTLNKISEYFKKSDKSD